MKIFNWNDFKFKIIQCWIFAIEGSSIFHLFNRKWCNFLTWIGQRKTVPKLKIIFKYFILKILFFNVWINYLILLGDPYTYSEVVHCRLELSDNLKNHHEIKKKIWSRILHRYYNFKVYWTWHVLALKKVNLMKSTLRHVQKIWFLLNLIINCITMYLSAFFVEYYRYALNWIWYFLTLNEGIISLTLETSFSQIDSQ